ncbi:unnamed protein product [Schistosoma turkestanicum]|nr:unnamed protein product [Schistosoma turkestanicum]
MSGLAARFLRSACLTFASRRIHILSKPNTVKCLTTSTRFFSSQADRQFNQILTNEIQEEKENAFTCSPPKGFKVVETNGSEVVIRKEYPDGLFVDIDINLAGSIYPGASEDSENPEDAATLEARPEFRIKLTKSSGRSLTFNCSFPGPELTKDFSEDDPNYPTYSVDSIGMERVPGYFVYTDLLDEKMFDHSIKLLLERGLDADFQQELQDFCTSEEHKLYLKFLDEFQKYCKE